MGCLLDKRFFPFRREGKIEILGLLFPMLLGPCLVFHRDIPYLHLYFTRINP